MNNSFSKKDCGELLTHRENQIQLLNMLDKFVGFCEENSIRYFISGGTLLGAIRHNGFIPWDDDVDVNVPRPDEEKLYEVSGGKIGQFILVGLAKAYLIMKLNSIDFIIQHI